MAQYGRITQGASWLSFEDLRRGRKITLSATETATSIKAYIRSQGSATNGTRATLYNASDGSQAYLSDVLTSFTDTTGQWRTYTISSSIAAGDYWLTIYAEAIAGGANTVQVAYDVVAANASLYEEWFNDGTVWPAQSADLTGLENGANTGDISIYLETAASSTQAPRSSAFLRMLMNN
jgi:hypothetical protein